MNARERVLKTFGRLPGKADRVPVQFEMCRQLTADIIQNDVSPERVLKFIELCYKHGKIQ